VWVNAKLGQVSALLFCLVIGSLVALSADRPIIGGVLLGIATAFKLYPLPLVVYALWVSWRRFGLSAIVTFLSLQLVSTILYPGLFYKYWLIVFPSIVPSNPLVNHSLTSLTLHQNYHQYFGL